MRFNRIGVIGRFKPLHNGAFNMLEACCKESKEVIIGIGSCNKYNLRNPFTAEESEEMIKRALNYDNFKIVKIPDFGHIPEYKDGKRWKQEIIDNFGELDAFITGNDYVKSLLQDKYKIIHSASLLQESKKIRLRSTEVRYLMAMHDERWKELVPKKVADYLIESGALERFRKEFGLQTIAYVSEGHDFTMTESKMEEASHAREI